MAVSVGMWCSKTNGVVQCADGPHMGSLLILTKAFQLSMQSAEWSEYCKSDFYEIQCRAVKASLRAVGQEVNKESWELE